MSDSSESAATHQQEVGISGPADEVTLVDFANAALRSWRWFVVLPVALGVLTGLYALSTARSYSASASFLPQSSGSSNAVVSGLARQFGISLGAESTAHSADFYAKLLTSRGVLRELSQTEVAITDDAGRRTVSIGQLMDVDASDPRAQDRLVFERLRDRISVSIGRTTGVVEFSVSARWPSLAEVLAAELLEIVHRFNVEAGQTRAIAEARFAGARLEEAYADLVESEDELKLFLERNRQYRQSPELLFEHDRLQRQVSIRRDVYVSLMQVHEQARINAVRDVPVITVLERPEGAAAPQGRGTVLRAVLAFLLGVIIAFLVAFFRDVGRRLRLTNDPAYGEFERLRRDLVHDLRRLSPGASGGPAQR